ncbi:MAG: ornithine cyclodeaminase family protein [Planctomycetes bacterium]|nr:ornithine cyclodeaminase family protein [Planctomycetota bacterium]
MPDRTLRFLSARDVAQALPMAAAIEAMRSAFRQLSDGQAVAPPRIYIEAAPIAGNGLPPHGDALFMPSYIPAEGRMGMKIVTIYPGNAALGLPLIQAIVVVLDAATGAPLAVMDGASLTAIRTGAASGAATDLLARPDAAVAAIFGAGPQARTQLEGVCAVRPPREARVHDPDAGRAAAFAAEMAERLGIAVSVAASPSQALAGADVVCTATTSREPVFSDSDIASGTHINAVGSYKPHVREVPEETVCRALVVVDHLPAALAEAGDLLIPIQKGLIGPESIHAELGELIAGRKPGRQSPAQITLFKSVGIAVQDLAAACAALANAERLGLGTEVPP